MFDKFLEAYRAQKEVNRKEKALMDKTIAQLEAFAKVDTQILEAIENNDLVLAQKLLTLRDSLPCPTCRRNQK